MKKIFFVVAMIFVSFFAFGTPVFAEGTENSCVPTAILGEGNAGEKQVCDDGSGSSVWSILRLVVEIMSIGVGILGVEGITVVGVQYLTAGGSEEKATKAKRRMYEIVIGLAAYAVLSGVIMWLMPSFTMEAPAGNYTGSGGSGGSQSTGKTSGFKYKNGKKYYEDKNGKRLTGKQKINDVEYYFNKKGEVQTGWVTIKNSKTGKVTRYYYKPNGKKAYGTISVKSKYNNFGGKDKWYLNSKTGALEGVDLAVPRIAQTLNTNCGPTSELMVRAYFIGKKNYTYNGATYPWNADVPWNSKCREGEIYESCVAEFGYKVRNRGRYEEDVALRQLFSGKPFIFRWYGQNAVNYGYAGGEGGHFMVISGYRNGVYKITDPAGSSVPRKTSIPANLFKQFWPTGRLTFYYFYK